MTLDSHQLISGYLDEILSPAEHEQLVRWLNECPANAEVFAQSVLLHDRLRNEMTAISAMSPTAEPFSLASNHRKRWSKPFAALMSSAAAATIVFVVLWKGLGELPASAAVAELNRIIAATAQSFDRTLQVTVEAVDHSPRIEKRSPADERRRPPKPPMDGAVLHIRDGRQFVLVRKERDGRSFITGSNGQTSWAIRPDGPVRVSFDLTRFSHDLPGHEHSIPLFNIQEGLEGLLRAYDVKLQAIDRSKDTADMHADVQQMIVAEKKSRSHRGPKRIEITYDVPTGHIQRMRFVEMPYAQEPPLTLVMNLVEERDLGRNFFDHVAHHDPDRVVEFE